MNKHTKRTTIRWVKRSLLILGGLAVVGLIVRALLPQPVDVDVAVASRGPLEVEVREDGQTRVRDRFVVVAPISGELERITVDPGTFVEAGAVITKIRPPQFSLLDARARSETMARLAAARAREKQAVSAIARARESKALADTEAQRTRRLVEQGAVSGIERERADLAAQLAEQDLSAAEQARAAAQAEIEALRAVLEPGSGPAVKPLDVVAPVRGRILRVLRESGGAVLIGTALVELGDPTALEVVVDVLSRDAERIRPGMEVEIETGGATPLHGTVGTVEPSAFTRVSALGVEEQRVNVIVCFDSPPNIGDAYRVDARIIIWRGIVLRIPAGALFRDRGHWATYVVDGGRARLRWVEIGHRGRVDIEITKGLREGERVILHPGDQVHDTSRIAIR